MVKVGHAGVTHRWLNPIFSASYIDALLAQAVQYASRSRVHGGGAIEEENGVKAQNQLMASAAAFLWLGCALAVSACSVFGKKHDDDANPPGSVNPIYPVAFVEREGDSLSHLSCDASGKECDPGFRVVVALKDLLPGLDAYLGIPSVRSALAKLETRELRVLAILRPLKSDAERASKAPARIQAIEASLGHLESSVAFLEQNISALDAFLAANPANVAALAQREADAEELASKQTEQQKLSAENSELQALIDGHESRQAQIDASEKDLRAVREELADKKRELTSRQADAGAGMERLQSLPQGVRVKISDLEQDMPWLSDVLSSAAPTEQTI